MQNRCCQYLNPLFLNTYSFTRIAREKLNENRNMIGAPIQPSNWLFQSGEEWAASCRCIPIRWQGRHQQNSRILTINQDDPPRSQYQSTESIHWHYKSPQAMVTPEQMALWWDLNLAAIKWLRTEKSFSWNRRCRRRHQHWNIETLSFVFAGDFVLCLLSLQETKKEREEETAAYKEAFDHYDWNRSGTIPTSVSL